MTNYNIPEIDLSKYHYHLPKSKIAEYPLENRAKSKQLIVNRESGEISSSIFSELPTLLNDKHHLVFNKTKVINARLRAKKQSGGSAEIFLLSPQLPSTDPQIALLSQNETVWKCMIGGKKIIEGMELHTLDRVVKISILSKDGNIGFCKFSWDGSTSFLDIIENTGNIPLPPYIERELKENDKQNYQTVYAKDSGSVAAPTAGLHFTPEILNELNNNGVTKSELTLHVGAGTFQPIKTDDIRNHKMHQELINVKKEQIIEILEAIELDKKIVAVGTTSIRTLESIAVFGEILNRDPNINQFLVSQWDPYQNSNISKTQSLINVLNWMELNKFDSIIGETGLLIIPSYKFRLVDHIITNFHQPESTLILLVAAFLGDDLWNKSYNYALENSYRFLSYGDSSLLL
ncbi:S-adenosylmethionine:tRNA ribosyltransferase-isomerase [Candidatus Kapabacteria bacterium]|nr:S-adenosylmethionine:tRNA ribosyltransferase-isomerase [Candidatus Kapabacteria bacterium]